MEDKGYSPFLQSDLFDSPEVEKILDTFVTKNNERYYKVRLVKICWVGEHDISNAGNVIHEFWSQNSHYMQETSLFESPLDPSPDEVHCHREITQEVTREDGSSHMDSILSDMRGKKIFENVSSETDSNDYMSHFTKDVDCLSGSLDFQKVERMSGEVARELEDINVMIRGSGGNAPGQVINNVDEEEEPLFIGCPSCKESFPSIKDLSLHQLSSICYDSGFRCSLCNIDFKPKHKSRFEKHIHGHMMRKCHICRKEFSRLAHLSTHLLIHENIRPWSCTECDKSFTDKSSLTKHQLIHSTQRNHRCDVCNKTFQRPAHLRRHKDSHEGVRKYKCNLCDSSFQLNNSLKAHMITHSGEKPYCCEICQRAFADKYSMKRHKLTHEEKVTVKCNECEKDFSRSSTFINHKCKGVNDGDKKEETISNLNVHDSESH